MPKSMLKSAVVAAVLSLPVSSAFAIDIVHARCTVKDENGQLLRPNQESVNQQNERVDMFAQSPTFSYRIRAVGSVANVELVDKRVNQTVTAQNVQLVDGQNYVLDLVREGAASPSLSLACRVRIQVMF